MKPAEDILSAILSLLFPKRCMICGALVHTSDDVCSRCERETVLVAAFDPLLEKGGLPGDFSLSGVASSFYYEGKMRDAVIRFKEKGSLTQARSMGRYLASSVNFRFRYPHFDVVTAVPSERARIRKRGHNPAQSLAAETARWLEMPSRYDLLYKARKNEPQHLLPAAQRRENVRDVFAAKLPPELLGKTILLVDDVFTTGSTMDSCASALLRAGAGRVYGASLTTTRLKNGD